MPDTPTAPPDHALAIDRLIQVDPTLSRDRAATILLATPPATANILTEQGRSAWADRQTAKAQAEYATSPAGRAATADALIAQNEADAADLLRADALLSGQGMSAADIASLPSDLRLRATGIRDAAAPTKPARKMGSSMIRTAQASPEEIALLTEGGTA